ncbi:MAG: hypothetical protein E6614_04925 [Bradyrhizobium sp.]|uniref:hypothetical protein n=1 Tax=Bradyrhizobium sp. TaxID=376 RepID=UPI00290308F1|nr:hypothetical protein [Bradyrhizobium sp.]MDU0958435.1 hypothetical protein [Bradyrhizobium sp.]MDU1689515.1 hypothetical protein [Bradyrhizobium sp.]MDU1803389.1 hypothetical protein [Bradyrhizobium sp.]MDU2923756.1 hypothetical protein [Bradyrhizobium sp.]MDU3044329.1 hypothetical protein [Bradyrhizobium sp.]
MIACALLMGLAAVAGVADAFEAAGAAFAAGDGTPAIGELCASLAAAAGAGLVAEVCGATVAWPGLGEVAACSACAAAPAETIAITAPARRTILNMLLHILCS